MINTGLSFNGKINTSTVRQNVNKIAKKVEKQIQKTPIEPLPINPAEIWRTDSANATKTLKGIVKGAVEVFPTNRSIDGKKLTGGVFMSPGNAQNSGYKASMDKLIKNTFGKLKKDSSPTESKKLMNNFIEGQHKLGDSVIEGAKRGMQSRGDGRSLYNWHA